MINVYLRWENFGLYVLVLEAVYLAGPPSDISNGDPGGMNTGPRQASGVIVRPGERLFRAPPYRENQR